jgi:hypothetical protein
VLLLSENFYKKIVIITTHSWVFISKWLRNPGAERDFWVKGFEKNLPFPGRNNVLPGTCIDAGHNGRAFFLPSHQ